MARGDDRLLTAAEEIRLAKRIERGDLAAKREMIERNLRLVTRLRRGIAGVELPTTISCRRGPSAWSAP
jgi:RNA polymerase primary sigma factor